jgi:hypothetical protein
MTLKGTAQFALLCMVLLTVLLLLDFVRDLTGMMRGIVPFFRFIATLIDLLAGVSVTLFFFVFQKRE